MALLWWGNAYPDNVPHVSRKTNSNRKDIWMKGRAGKRCVHMNLVMTNEGVAVPNPREGPGASKSNKI
jgi:hypothetical protein